MFSLWFCKQNFHGQLHYLCSPLTGKFGSLLRNHTARLSLKQIDAEINLTPGKWFVMALLPFKSALRVRRGNKGQFDLWLQCLLSLLEINGWDSEKKFNCLGVIVARQSSSFVYWLLFLDFKNVPIVNPSGHMDGSNTVTQPAGWWQPENQLPKLFKTISPSLSLRWYPEAGIHILCPLLLQVRIHIRSRRSPT